MKVFITGGTGFVGRAISSRLLEQGYNVTLLTRSIGTGRSAPAGLTYLEGDPTEKGKWQGHVADHEIIINLAGASIFSFWTNNKKKLITDSRILTTQNLVDALSGVRGKEAVLLSASAVGYYGFRDDTELDEASAPGDGFLASVTRKWEETALQGRDSIARVVLCRFGIVLGSKGGALLTMVKPIRWYVGCPLGSGRQWFSWIHQEDLAEILLFLIKNKEISGPVNCTAPNPVTNRELTKEMAKAVNRPVLLPAIPSFILKAVMGEFATSLIYGQKVLPKRLLTSGFNFKFPTIQGALKDILA
ncbi:conserved hypothetical protein [uncultured Desulfobacterium sp.]|uniref:TIGR01777 family protein n=1 Tax=uncultured Desulfobacterium sp. TaxID=201089 RepID=A0A445MYD2_9BACT|nr:conserved hypothetical protein [uncultured Desulfobacterium sp.]